jgi:hypothetical protein
MTEKKTISEAMAELKLINAKVNKKTQFIKDNCVSYNHVEDPYKKDGGRHELIKQEEQAIEDLLKRYEVIREKIMEANLATEITINNISKSIYSWLVWRREVKEKQDSLYNTYQRVESATRELEQRPQSYKKEDKDGNILNEFVKMTSNIKLDKYRKELDNITEAFEKLDGILSLKNATIFIEI